MSENDLILYDPDGDVWTWREVQSVGVELTLDARDGNLDTGPEGGGWVATHRLTARSVSAGNLEDLVRLVAEEAR